jgi:hypothetical protein
MIDEDAVVTPTKPMWSEVAASGLEAMGLEATDASAGAISVTGFS